MRRIPYALYYLPPRPGAGPRAKPYPSRYRMSPEEAAAAGALGQVPGTVELREIPETDEERASIGHRQSAGRDGAQ